MMISESTIVVIVMWVVCASVGDSMPSCGC